jgi:hypothetical protein
MATGTLGTQARQFDWQATHYLRKKVNYNDANIGAADKVKVGMLPAGAIIVGVYVRIETAFNAGTTNVLTVGTNAGADNNIVNAADVDETTVATTEVTRGLGLTIASDTTVYVLYTQTGTAATAGVATIIVEYIPNNDQ